MIENGRQITTQEVLDLFGVTPEAPTIRDVRHSAPVIMGQFCYQVGTDYVWAGFFCINLQNGRATGNLNGRILHANLKRRDPVDLTHVDTLTVDTYRNDGDGTFQSKVIVHGEDLFVTDAWHSRRRAVMEAIRWIQDRENHEQHKGPIHGPVTIL